MRRAIQYILIAVTLAAAVVASVACLSFAEEDGSPVVIGTYRTLHSRVLNEERTLLVSLPQGYEEANNRYPVLYILYGGQVRGYFADAVHIVDRLNESTMIPELIIVGVKNVDRYRDNLPVNRDGAEGGAGKFLQFFTEDLIPFIDDNYRTEDFRILLGPQAGAAFALYALMEEPGLFRANIVTNPFWTRSSARYLLAKSEECFAGVDPLNAFLFITCETSDDNEATMALLDSLVSVVESGSRSGFTLMLNPLGEEGAGDWIPSPGLKEGLKAYFKAYRFPDDMAVGGLEDLTGYYGDLSARYGYDVEIPQFTLIRRGNEVENSGNLDGAQVMYEYALHHYPHGLTSLICLAGVHQKKGEYEQAIAYYEEFLRRSPDPMVGRRLASLKRYVSDSAAYAIERAVMEGGTQAGLSKFEELRSGDGGGFYFDENEFNALGYAFVARGMVEAAIEVFKMNVELNPESANAYDSLGEAYLMNENVELAVRNYRKSLKLNPDNANAREVLERLGESAD